MSELDKLKERIAQPVTEQFIAGVEYGWLEAKKQDLEDLPFSSVNYEMRKKLKKEIKELEAK